MRVTDEEDRRKGDKEVTRRRRVEGRGNARATIEIADRV